MRLSKKKIQSKNARLKRPAVKKAEPKTEAPVKQDNTKLDKLDSDLSRAMSTIESNKRDIALEAAIESLKADVANIKLESPEPVTEWYFKVDRDEDGITGLRATAVKRRLDS